jgi:hypothetical protein
MSWDAWGQLMGLYMDAEQGNYTTPRLTERITVDEWTLPEEGEKLASSVAGLFDRFIELASTRWQKGVEEYRGGDETLPFTDDPLLAATEECADIFAYSKEAANQGLLSPTEQDQLNCLAYDAFKLIVHVQEALKEKHDKEADRKAREEASKESGLLIET